MMWVVTLPRQWSSSNQWGQTRLKFNRVWPHDARIEADAQETVTAGEAVKAMIINGLGFSNRPLMLTPPFFENLPMELLFRPGDRCRGWRWWRPRLGNRSSAGRRKTEPFGKNERKAVLAVAHATRNCYNIACRCWHTSRPEFWAVTQVLRNHMN